MPRGIRNPVEDAEVVYVAKPNDLALLNSGTFGAAGLYRIVSVDLDENGDITHYDLADLTNQDLKYGVKFPAGRIHAIYPCA